MVYQPKYLKIAEELKKALLAGNLNTSDALPGENAMAVRWGVSRRTVRAALQILEDDGFILRKKGSGSFIAPPEMHRKRLHADVAILVEAAPPEQMEHSFDFLLHPSVLSEGIIQGLAGKGHWLRYIPWDTQNAYYSSEDILKKGIDGFVFPGLPQKNLELLHEVIKRRIPHIVYETSLKLKGLNIIAADEFSAGRNAVRILKNSGVQKCAVVIGHLGNEFRNTANRRRLEGIKAGIAETGMTVAPEDLLIEQRSVSGHPPAETFASALHDMMKKPDPPRTVILSSISIADIFVSILRELGLRAGEDVRCITFRGACSWKSVHNLSEVKSMEYFDCDNESWVRKGIDLLDEWFHTPTFRPGVHLIESFYCDPLQKFSEKASCRRAGVISVNKSTF